MRRIALLLALMPMAAMAEDWRVLSGDEVRVALEDRKLIYGNGAWQEFRGSGRTLYNAGEDSWGYWAVRDSQYCSMWPPSDLWACYNISSDGAQIRFTGSGGDITDGQYAE